MGVKPPNLVPLISRHFQALQKIHHSDQGLQYAVKEYDELL